MNPHRMWELIFSLLTLEETGVQRGKGIGPGLANQKALGEIKPLGG